uniref:F-box domain-containing protein n=1 Tax=Schistosoma mansoni TaxID=6183 RepID=A0A5K4FDZ6_SCHMA
MINLESSIKEMIQKVLISSGEPFHTSDLIINLLYDYLRINANQFLIHLPKSKLPSLNDLLLCCQSQPIRLCRIVKYFQTIYIHSFIKTNEFDLMNNKQFTSLIHEYTTNNCSNHDDDGGGGGDPLNNKSLNDFSPSNNSNWLRLNYLFNQLSIPLPYHHHHPNHSNHNKFWQLYKPYLNQVYKQLNKGRLLRLKRIDLKLCHESMEHFLSFYQLRQTASLLNLTKSHHLKNFLYWFYYCTFNTNTTNNNVSSNENNNKENIITMEMMNEYYLKMLNNSTSSSSSSSASSSSSTINSTSTSGSSPHEGLHILAYLLNGDLLDIIDMVLYNRQKLNINLSSPITLIEIKQVLHIFTSIIYPRQSTISSS